MKKKNIILISIVFIVVVVCILAAVIGFGLSDEPKESENDSVKLSQDIPGEKETEKESDVEKSEEKESDEETSDEETTEETTTDDNVVDEETNETSKGEPEEETTTKETTAEETTTKQEETTTTVHKEELDRFSFEYMLVDGKSVYTEYNVKIKALYESINAERVSAGMSQLTFDKDISYIACARASQVAFEGDMEGNSDIMYYELMEKSGIVFSKAVENTAAGYEEAKEVVSGEGTSWKTSAKHYDNIISDKYTRVGVGVDYSETMGYVWVAIFSN